MTVPLLTATPGFLTEWCNPFGGEQGAQRVLGGLGNPSNVTQQWYCKKRSIGHFRMMCEHGHRGQQMPLCEDHARQFKSRDMTFCPRCNAEPPGHKCKLTLTEIS